MHTPSIFYAFLKSTATKVNLLGNLTGGGGATPATSTLQGHIKRYSSHCFVHYNHE